MWIERNAKKAKFINELLSLNRQVLLVRGSRQVGKTSFILNALDGLQEYPQIKINLLYPSSRKLGGVDYKGRDFFCASEDGETLLRNIEFECGAIAKLQKPVLIFVDEADRYQIAIESIQTLAEVSDKLKFIFTGSNLENIIVRNASTGRKKFFDLYPVTFSEFVEAGGNDKILAYLNQLSFSETSWSDHFHNKLNELQKTYIRIGGMPKIVSSYLDIGSGASKVSEVMTDLVFSVEENVKTVLGEKAKLYEYEDVLRKLAFLSMNTLKFSHLQVQHAGRSEARKLVAKTVGARVAHKIRFFEMEKDLSKYIISDCGIVNYLMSGSNILQCAIDEKRMAILHETFVGMELISNLTTRDDLFYWKSENKAELEFVLRHPFIGIDVKTNAGNIRSLNSFALLEPDATHIVKICNSQPRIDKNHEAILPNYENKRRVTLVTIPHYLTYRLFELLK